MKKVLIAVENIHSSKAVLYTMLNLVQMPEETILLNVQRLEGRSLMTEMLGDAEMSTLRESLKDTEHQEKLDKKSEKILAHYKQQLTYQGFSNIKTVVRNGQPAEEILRVAEAEGAELILLGFRAKNGLNRLITGSAAADIEKKSKIPVLTAKRPVLCEEVYTWRDAVYAVSLFSVVFLILFIAGIILEKNGAF